ncbi:MAG: hypothetical protein CMB80_04685 [Flammeovirgaceae bacterium]|nr:hypothetical protein [Flammeovirgaceae bacterium]|tara:strand:+ start:2178 stop:2882 length:705 start_codon:yes stop_codon:yes gene_type:complete
MNSSLKILSFCVYGDDPKYTVGMKRNIELCPEIYGEDWKVRVYVDNSVPPNNIREYKDLGAQVFDVTKANITGGMFWRFLPFIDESVDVFCVRDADSRLSKREKAAVDDWLDNNTSLHIMRDHPHHNYVIMGGMFGFNKIPNGNYTFAEDYGIFIGDNYQFKKMDDMIFLHSLHRVFSHSVTAHDSYSRGGCDNNGAQFITNSKPFPVERQPNEGFIGEIFNEDESYEYQRSLL